MEIQEKVAREYLEEVTSFIEDMCEKDSKAKVEEKVERAEKKAKEAKEDRSFADKK